MSARLAEAMRQLDRDFPRVTNVVHFRSLRDGSMFLARTSATIVTRQRYVRDARRQNRLVIASKKRLRELEQQTSVAIASIGSTPLARVRS